MTRRCTGGGGPAEAREHGEDRAGGHERPGGVAVEERSDGEGGEAGGDDGGGVGAMRVVRLQPRSRSMTGSSTGKA